MQHTPDTKPVAALLARADALLDLHRPGDADALVRQALAIDPNCAAAHVLRARVCFAWSFWAGARASLDAALAIEPEDAHVHALAAVATLNDDEFDPANVLVNLFSFRSAEARRNDRAQAHADTAAALDASSAYAHAVRARVLLTRERVDAALAAARAALALDATDPTARTAFHDCLVRLGRDDEARAFTTETLRHRPEDETAHLRLGALAADRGDYAAALEHARTALRADPNDRFAQAAYWHAVAHTNPAARAIVAVRRGMLFLLRPITGVAIRWPSFAGGLVLLFALGCLIAIIAASSSGVMLPLWIAGGIVAILWLPALLLGVLHLILLFRHPASRRPFDVRFWLAVATAIAWVVTYTVLARTGPARAKPPITGALVAAIMPLVAVVLARFARPGWPRWLFALVAVASTGAAVVALLAVRRSGNSEHLAGAMFASLIAILCVEWAVRRTTAAPSAAEDSD